MPSRPSLRRTAGPTPGRVSIGRSSDSGRGTPPLGGQRLRRVQATESGVQPGACRRARHRCESRSGPGRSRWLSPGTRRSRRRRGPHASRRPRRASRRARRWRSARSSRHVGQDLDPLGRVRMGDRNAAGRARPRCFSSKRLRELLDRLLPAAHAADGLDHAVADREDRLDVEKRPGERLRLADAAALLQVLEGRAS